MYADDVVLYTVAKDKEQAAQKLTAAMCNINNWIQRSHLHLNLSKTVCMYFSKKVNRDDSSISIQDKKLETVQQFKYRIYLGFTILFVLF